MTNGKAQAKDHTRQEQSFQINYFILCAFLFLINLIFSSAFQQLLLASPPLLPSCSEQKPLCSLTLLTQAERPFMDILKELSFSSSSLIWCHKHSIASSAPHSRLTFQNPHLKRELSIVVEPLTQQASDLQLVQLNWGKRLRNSHHI